MAMAKTKSNTDRFRPEEAPGATVEGLSLPQQELKSDAAAVQKHQVAPVMTQVTSEAIFVLSQKIKKEESRKILRNAFS
eukprot:CAMPEP_0178824892 /NCGR_PEP_ID=MMETSP0746-20121128/5923_1 /TAXON_ID=913974 /ORGANISM="Nitzschia punctata, Strain CCMP561" /LENGTH=78 /DNA_ID=CAMNT_0020486605 /DNA_START=152 /DNA_END=385 /DNA_ORIENTATION=-